jgi:hypothetical protein
VVLVYNAHMIYIYIYIFIYNYISSPFEPHNFECDKESSISLAELWQLVRPILSGTGE